MGVVESGRTSLGVADVALRTVQSGSTLHGGTAFATLDALTEASGFLCDAAQVPSDRAQVDPGGVSEESAGRWPESLDELSDRRES